MTAVAGRVFNILLNGMRKFRDDGRELIPIVILLVSGYNLLVISINLVKKVTIRLKDNIKLTIFLNTVLSFTKRCRGSRLFTPLVVGVGGDSLNLLPVNSA